MMAGEACGNLNNGGGPEGSLKPSTAATANAAGKSYLKRYPYLFVRENDQTDYFCTLCDAYLREDELQSHLFDGHQAENISNFFVRVLSPSSSDKGILFQQLQRHVHICVVCWAKIPEPKDCASHRLACRADNSGDGSGGGGGPDTSLASSLSPPQNVISTPDIANLLNRGSSPAGSNCSADDDLVMNGTNGSSRSQSPPVTAPDVIIDQHRMIMRNGGGGRRAGNARHGPSASVQHPCVQCSLCSMVVPSQGHCGHLRDFHRITTIEEAVACCPLCATPVSLVDLGAHLISAHGITSRAAATSVLFWVICGLAGSGATNNNNFLGKQQQQQHPGPLGPPGLLPPNMIQIPKTIPAISALTSQPPLPPPSSGAGGGISVKPTSALLENQAAVAAAAAKLAASGLGASQLPTVLQSLLTTTGGGIVVPGGLGADQQLLLQQHHHNQQQQEQQEQQPATNRLAAVENIVSRFTRCHVSPNGKESIQCLVCSKWFAVPPVKHLRGHMITFKEEKRRLVSLVNGAGHVCIICYDVFDDIVAANQHFALKHEFSMASIFPNGIPSPANNDDIVELNSHAHGLMTPSDELPTVIDHSVQPLFPGMARVTPAPPAPPLALTSSKKKSSVPPSGLKPGVELDNAGRVKSGKVRKQCELCGEWSNIKWFFKHMSEVHQALFCRCCREYLPIHEQEEHRRWHAEPPYMGQKIRIENGQPVIVDRKERASLTPIGSLAPWGGSSGGMVVKAVDTGPPTPRNTSASKKRKAAASGLATPPAEGGGSPDATPPKKSSPPQQPLVGHMVDESGGGGNGVATAGTALAIHNKETLMPKETCPVCGILITYKNLARHIKLRHRIKYKYCHRCRQLVPNNNFEEHKATCVPAPGAVTAPGGAEVSLDGEAVTSEVGEEEEEEADDEQAVDPTEFLEANATEYSSPEAAAAAKGGDARKSDEFRAATSKNKLHSLLGKAFKHPRRKCAICDYTVSYSNFKRHLRNAHPQHYSNQDPEEDFKKTIDSLSHAVEDDEETGGSGRGYVGHPMEDEDEDSDGEGLVIQEDDDADAGKGDGTDGSVEGGDKFKECKACGDHILEEFLERHMSTNHPQKGGEAEEKEESPKAEEKALEEMPIPLGKTDKNKAITDEILKD